jgi:lysine-N-methylase
VPVDEAAYRKYQGVEAGPLRMALHSWVVPVTADGETEGSVFADIRMDGAHRCPLLSGERLCPVQLEMGEGFLSHACATYPRIVHEMGGAKDAALALSCPEAARVVLLDPELMSPKLRGLDRVRGSGSFSGPAFFREIRETVVALVRNRTYPLWQRLFLLGVFCRRLDSIACGELKRSVPDFLTDFEAAVGRGTLRTAMETLPLDGAAQLDMVLRMAGMLLHRSNVRPRFAECVQAFTAGIGNGPGATLESLSAHYACAHDRSFAPFFAHHPHILENYILNTIFRCQFPYGKNGMEAGARACMTKEFALLTAQFALMRGLLIGVAGFYGEQFSSEHVVHTVQAAAKHFEHHPEFLNEAHTLLVESGMEGARGLAILLRDVGGGAAIGTHRRVSAEIHAAAPGGMRV